MSVRGSLVDKSGTCTLGGTAQTIAAYNAGRRYLLVANISDTAMQINIGATATADSIPLAATTGKLEWFAFIPTGLVSMLCATTGKKFVCKEG